MRGVHGGSPRLGFLDGMRGFAALYIVFHHAALLVSPRDMGTAARAGRFLLRHGHSFVAVFIVLSGFCLMRPVTHDPLGRLADGFWAYLGRRVRRILPAYYGSLGLCWLLALLIPPLSRPGQSMWDRALPMHGGGVAISHLLLIHNLSPYWIYKVQPPLWTVATEWQLYLAFPALVAFWRRAGTGTTVALGFGLGYALAASSTLLGNPALRQLCPWYLGLFTLGMAASVLSLESQTEPFKVPSSRDRPIWMLVGVAACVISCGIALAVVNDRTEMLTDPFVGVLTAAMIVRWTRISRSRESVRWPPLLRLLESRWSAGLGAWSYSLYLTHFPLLALLDMGLRAARLSPDMRLGMMTLAAMPLCLPVAFAFSMVLERSNRRRSVPVAAETREESCAPAWLVADSVLVQG